MSIKLKLDYGTIKEYSTFFRYGGGENDYKPPTCETKCGIKWYPNQEPGRKGCDHFDCAMYVLESGINSYPRSIFILIGGMLLLILLPIAGGAKSIGIIISYSFLMIIITIIISILFRNIARESAKKKMELIEFRDHGTINGVKAQKI